MNGPQIITGLAAMLLAASLSLSAQSETELFYAQSQKINNTGMYILGSWAIANIATGAYGWKNGTGANMYFHQMNVFWNTVNISIATFALISNGLADHSMLNAGELINQHLKTERLYLINAGLDLVYIGAGFGLKALAQNNSNKRDRYTGYGNSLILQGGFLMLFDAAMYFIQHSRRMTFLSEMNMDISLGLNTMGITINF